MIANNSLRSAISLTHLSITLFAFSVFVTLTITEKIKSALHFLNSDALFVFIFLFLISGLAFYGFVTWQTNQIRVSKRISYILILLTIIECLFVIEFNSSKIAKIVTVCIPIYTLIVFLFLLVYSIPDSLKNNKDIDASDSNFLDIDFLTNNGNYTDEDKSRIVGFWKINRIFSFSCLFLAIFMGLAFIEISAPKEVLLFPIFFFIGSIVLWIFPKAGSWIFSVLSSVSAISILGAFCILFLFDLPNNAKEKIPLVISLSMAVLSITFLCVTLSIIILSKEAKQQWRKNK